MYQSRQVKTRWRTACNRVVFAVKTEASCASKPTLSVFLVKQCKHIHFAESEAKSAEKGSLNRFMYFGKPNRSCLHSLSKSVFNSTCAALVYLACLVLLHLLFANALLQICLFWCPDFPGNCSLFFLVLVTLADAALRKVQTLAGHLRASGKWVNFTCMCAGHSVLLSSLWATVCTLNISCNVALVTATANNQVRLVGKRKLCVRFSRNWLPNCLLQRLQCPLQKPSNACFLSMHARTHAMCVSIQQTSRPMHAKCMHFLHACNCTCICTVSYLSTTW